MGFTGLSSDHSNQSGSAALFSEYVNLYISAFLLIGLYQFFQMENTSLPTLESFQESKGTASAISSQGWS